MDKIFSDTLTACIAKAKKGEIYLNVFDLMYETCLPYAELKDILDRLVSQNELVQTDVKTYKFIGDLNRNFEEGEKKQPYTPVFQKVEDSPHRDAARAARRTFMEQLRQEKLLREVGEDDEDGRFEERESFLFEPPVVPEDDTEEEESLTDFAIKVFKNKLKPEAYSEVPPHFLWEEREEFLQACADHLIILMNSDRQMGRVKALKKAKAIFSELLKTREMKTAEVYEYIVYALQNMSDYYFNKIRENMF